MFSLIAVPAYLIFIAEKFCKNIDDIQLMIKIENLFSDLDYQNKFKILFNTFLYIRKYIFSAILVLMYGHTLAQLLLFSLMNIVLIFIMVISHPYKEIQSEKVNLKTEIILLLNNIIFMVYSVSDENFDNGISIIILVVILLLIHSFNIIRSLYQSIIDSVKEE